MATDVQNRGATQATQEARTLPSRVLDVNTTDHRLSIHDGSTAGGVPHVNWRDAVNQEFTYAVGSGTNAITASLAKAPSAYQAGQGFAIKIANNNTGSTTLNIDSLGAKTIKKQEDGALVNLEADDLVQNTIRKFYYNGTDMVLDGGVSGGGEVWELIEHQEFTSGLAGEEAIEFTGIDTSYRELYLDGDFWYNDDSTTTVLKTAYGNLSYGSEKTIFTFGAGLGTVYFNTEMTLKKLDFNSAGTVGKVWIKGNVTDFSGDFTSGTFEDGGDFDSGIERVKIRIDDTSGGEDLEYAQVTLYGKKWQS